MPRSKKELFLENKEEIIDMFNNGETLLDIERKLDISRHTIKKYLSQLGFERTKDEVNKITQIKREESMLKKYGVVNISQVDDLEIQNRRTQGVKRRCRGQWSGDKNPNFKNKIGNNFGFRYGIREDLGNIFFRSSWEANYARFLNFKQEKWQYEYKTFELKDGRTYTPDFYLENEDVFVEVKGFWRDDAKEKFELFKLEYSEVKIKLIQEKEYKKLLKENKDFIDFE